MLRKPKTTGTTMVKWCLACNWMVRTGNLCPVCKGVCQSRAVVLCVACEGTGWNSKKRRCFPCNATGIKK